jgi:hypothetical protein
MTSIATLVEDLATGSGARLERLSRGLFSIWEWRGRTLERPTRLAVSDESLAEYLRAHSSDASEVFPDVDPPTAAYRLLLVDLDESFVGGVPAEIVVDSGGVRLIGVQPRSAVALLDEQGLADGDRGWVPGHGNPTAE